VPNILLYACLALGIAGCSGTSLAEMDLPTVERVAGLAVIAWGTLKFVLTPLLAQMVRKAVERELTRLEELEESFQEHGQRLTALEQRLDTLDVVVAQVAQMRDTLVELRTHMRETPRLLERLIDTAEGHTRELGVIHGRVLAIEQGQDR
jgi:hypothetical protein